MHQGQVELVWGYILSFFIHSCGADVLHGSNNGFILVFVTLPSLAPLFGAPIWGALRSTGEVGRGCGWDVAREERWDLATLEVLVRCCHTASDSFLAQLSIAKGASCGVELHATPQIIEKPSSQNRCLYEASS